MKIVTVVGARPQFIKAAHVSQRIRCNHREIWVHTGQHYDSQMSDIFFKQLKLPAPDYHLGIGSDSHARQTAKMLQGIDAVLDVEQPDLVLVFGDTNSTLSASLAAAKKNIPIAHVEAGLRCFNRTIPEEINRIVTDHLSAILFCPNDEAVAHLNNEGLDRLVYQVGDVMYDCLLSNLDTALQQSQILNQLRQQPKQYCVATLHRAENTNSRTAMEQILAALAQLSITVILPLHPRTARFIDHWQLHHYLQSSQLIGCSPLSYFDMLCLTHHSMAVLTDSGGLQKEAYMLKVPCITLRKETEWMDTVRTGWNRLVPPETIEIVDAFNNLSMPEASPPLFGDGNAAERIGIYLDRYELDLLHASK